MEKYTPPRNLKKFQNSKSGYNDKPINRAWGNATRLEHLNNRNKNKGKKD
jgi:hypothetical protein